MRPLPVVDREYLMKMKPMGDPSKVKYHLPGWLRESVIKLNFIEELKKQHGMKEGLAIPVQDK